MTVESYGTMKLRDTPALPEAVDLARASGVDVSSHVARCIADTSLAELDLVLGFDEQHVREAVVEAGAARERSFTARHFVRLLGELPAPGEEDPVTRARARVQRADELRGADMPATTADNLPDPLGRPWRVQRDIAAEIRELSLALTRGLFGVADPSVLPPTPERLRRQRSPLLQRLRLR